MVQVIVPEPRMDPDSTCAARLVGGVNDTEVEEVFVAMVPEALPNVYVRVCVNDCDALVMVIVRACPISVEDPVTAIVEALGIVVRIRADPDAREMFGTMLPVCVFRTAVIAPAAIVLEPSVPWVIVVVPEAISQESLQVKHRMP